LHIFPTGTLGGHWETDMVQEEDRSGWIM